jgi:transcriptional regulator with XRE-family HTH domain
LGAAIREVREQRGLSVGELAGAAGVAWARVEALEAGRLDPDLELLMGVADAVGVRLSAFVVRAGELGAAARVDPSGRGSSTPAEVLEM